MRKALFFFLLFSIGCKTSYYPAEKQTTQYAFSDSANSAIDSSYYYFLTPYREKMEKEMNQVLGRSETALERGNPESRLGNFVSDACLHQAKMRYKPTDGKGIDFAFFNSGGLRKALPAGAITRGDIFQLMPFENALVILSCTGSDVEKLINFIASKGGGPVGGIRFTIRDGKPEQIFIDGQPFEANKKYKVLTSDYLANGGDNFSFLTDLPREDIALKVRDALIEEVKEKGTANISLKIELDGRVSNVK